MSVESIKQSIDLTNYVRSYGIELQPHGKNDLKGLCPFHSDHNPSLIVTPSSQLFHCPVCSKGGSVIDFAMFYHNVDLKEAIQLLRKSNSSCQKSLPKPQPQTPSLSPERTNQLLEKVVSFYEKTFADVPEGRTYLESRGITDAGLYSTHRIGYCNGTLTNILPKSGSIHHELKELGILLDSGSERFTGCIVVPVFDIEGNVITLYGRYSADDQKKHMFLPGRSKGLWNLASIKTYPEIILVESIIDGLSVQMAGHHNVVSIQGTNGFNNGQADLLSEQGVQNLIFLLDGDEAGHNTGKRLIEQKTSAFANKRFILPDDHDPNSYLNEYGTEQLAAFILEGVGSRDQGLARESSKTDKDSQPLSPKTHSLADGGFSVCYGLRRYEIHGLEKGSRKLRNVEKNNHPKTA